MAKIVIGAGHDKSVLQFTGSAPANSDAEIIVGDGYDMSRRQIDFLFHEEKALSSEISSLQRQISDLQRRALCDAKLKAVCDAAAVIAATAEKVKQERKWYSVSAEGLLEAAKAVGGVADPLVKTAIGVVQLLGKLKEAL